MEAYVFIQTEVGGQPRLPELSLGLRVLSPPRGWLGPTT
jgi:hypothetical protein